MENRQPTESQPPRKLVSCERPTEMSCDVETQSFRVVQIDRVWMAGELYSPPAESTGPS